MTELWRGDPSENRSQPWPEPRPTSDEPTWECEEQAEREGAACGAKAIGGRGEEWRCRPTCELDYMSVLAVIAALAAGITLAFVSFLAS